MVLLLWLLPFFCWCSLSVATIFAIFCVWHRVKFPKEKERVIAFFHPYCSAGGGGERVLWAIIQVLGEIDTQGLRLKVVIYTVDPPAAGESYKKDVLEKVEERFSLTIPPSLDITFVHLNEYAHFLERANRLSLLVESIGTMRLAYQALVRCTPTIFFDTTGCAFTYLIARVLFGCKVIAYVHYPTISTDMLSMVWERRRVTYNNQAYITNSRITTVLKLIYYTMFAFAYGCVGSLATLVFVNSTWTFNHINSLWWVVAHRGRIRILFPPCRISAVPVTIETQQQRERIILSIGQFRPEKDHELQIESLGLLFERHPTLKGDIKMVLVGGCRGTADEDRLRHLQSMAKKRGLEDSAIFSVNQPYSVVENWLKKASVGIHTMWNEHFGIGVVEMMSAGLITIAHDSGGPKSDIVVPWDGRPTGLLASTQEEYAGAIFKAFILEPEAACKLRQRAQASAQRFSDEQFVSSFKQQILESHLL